MMTDMPDTTEQWVEIFRAGYHEDSRGVGRSFSTDDLDQIIANTQSGNPVPHVITHNELYSPFAYARSSQFRRVGEVLEARMDGIEPQFAELIKSGRLYERSIRLLPIATGGWKVGHIAWLGAEPPAVEGLKPVQFNSGMQSIDFNFKGAPAVPEANPTPNQNSGASGGITTAQLEVAKAEVAKVVRAEVTAEFSARENALKAELKLERDKQRRSQWENKIEAAKREGRLTPAQSEGLCEFAMSLPSDSVMEFSRAGNGKSETVKLSAEQWFTDFMASLPKQVALSTTPSTSSVDAVDDTDSEAIAAKALEYQRAQADKGVVVSVSAAVAHVTQKGNT